jgi:hypothetical protein
VLGGLLIFAASRCCRCRFIRRIGRCRGTVGGAANFGPRRHIPIAQYQSRSKGRDKRVQQDRKTGNPDGEALIFPKTFHIEDYSSRMPLLKNKLL